MKKSQKLLSLGITLSLLFAFFTFSVSAQEISEDPYFDYHLQISKDIDQLREVRNAKINMLQEEISSCCEQASNLYKDRVSYSDCSQIKYNDLVQQIESLDADMLETRQDFYDSINQYLNSLGFIAVNDENTQDVINKDIHLSATDAGKMQTNSSVYYNSSTNEFYYYVEYDYTGKNLFGEYVGLNDSWGDYDLVSMQHKDNADWHWNNIIVTANLAVGNRTSSIAGKADKYGILDNGVSNACAVSNRNDFWNGCVFNIKDANVKVVTGQSSTTTEVKTVTLEGWLAPTGSNKTANVKSEYEHNYEKNVFSKVEINGVSLDNDSFSMNVTYEKFSGSWQRSSGSRLCTIPN